MLPLLLLPFQPFSNPNSVVGRSILRGSASSAERETKEEEEEEEEEKKERDRCERKLLIPQLISPRDIGQASITMFKTRQRVASERVAVEATRSQIRFPVISGRGSPPLKL